MTEPPDRRVFYVGERFGWHVCDIYFDEKWVVQVRFNPQLHRYYKLSAPDVALPPELLQLNSYEDWRAFVDQHVVSRP